jgi:hypothetical protein
LGRLGFYPVRPSGGTHARTVGDEADADGELPAEDLHLGLLGLELPHAALEPLRRHQRPLRRAHRREARMRRWGEASSLAGGNGVGAVLLACWGGGVYTAGAGW